MNLLAFPFLAGLCRLATCATDVGKRPGAANGYWCRQPSVGTELDAKSEKPLGLLLHVPAAGRGQTGTFPLFAGAIPNAASIRQSDVARAQGISSALLGCWQRQALEQAVPNSARRAPVNQKR